MPAVVAAFNNEVTRLTGKKPKDAIRAKAVTHNPPPACCSWQVNWPQGTLVPSYARVRYLYQPGKLEGGRRRATDPVWSLSIHTIRNAVRQSGHPALYYLTDGPSRGFVREELQIVPSDTELPPARILIRCH